ncbi:MAG: hypothetical protein C0508_04820 [Cyanobacteria bacterium PR.023]|nr:hypothetical protein [Cyanobacteria bacterium PR.023]MDQ5936868.1 hypothetical protein [Cyanobacteriota bacterium erpe_2018_sw_21hr_WHONDRS-SW48-000092_B_bin.40]
MELGELPKICYHPINWLQLTYSTMLSNSEPAILHAISNVRYQVVPWLRHQRIDSKDYDEVASQTASLCAANGLPLRRSDLIEPQCRKFFEEHRYFHFVFGTQVEARTVPLVTPETLLEMGFLGEKLTKNLGDTPDVEAMRINARNVLLSADKGASVMLMARLIPFGSLPGETRPEAVLCIDACLTNFGKIWGPNTFSIEN